MEERKETYYYDLEESRDLEVNRATSKRCLSICTLLREPFSLMLTTQKGRHWQTHGHTHFGKTYLDVEEALFLTECGVLEIRVDGLPISIQQAYHTLLQLPSGLSLVLYQVYATLKRCGYIVLRRHLIGLSDKPWPVCSLCRSCRESSDLAKDVQWSAGFDLLQVYHSSRVLSNSNRSDPLASLIVSRHVNSSDFFPTPSSLLVGEQLSGYMLAGVHETNSLSFYKLTMNVIPTLD